MSPGGQCPMPSHDAALVKVAPPEGHEAARHSTLELHLRQAPMPLHLPSFPQVDSIWMGQPPPSSGMSSGSGLHRPRRPVTAHDLHTSVQAVSQQKPSTQWLLLHSSASLQVPPL